MILFLMSLIKKSKNDITLIIFINKNKIKIIIITKKRKVINFSKKVIKHF